MCFPSLTGSLIRLGASPAGQVSCVVRRQEGVGVVKVNPQHIMALRRLTDQSISACRDALVEAGGDLVAVVRKLQWSPCCGIYATDAELATVLAEYGVTYTPEVREPVILPDAEVVAELTGCGAAMSDYFLIEGLVCSINARGELMGCSIDDEDLAVSATAYLRRIGAREFSSFAEFRAWRSDAEPLSWPTDLNKNENP